MKETAAWGAPLLVELYRQYAADLARLERFASLRRTIGKSYAGEERRVLYLLTRFKAPDLVIEFSPKRGWSTLHIAAALEDNGKGRVVSFELEPVYAALTRRTLRGAGLAHRGEVVVGDVREEFPRRYHDRERWGSGPGLAFLFIDSDHGGPFAEWYLANLFPLVRQGGLIHVHDVEGSPELIATGRTLYSEPSGEEVALSRHLIARRDGYRWFSVADLVRDAGYVEAVRAFGGGDLSFTAGGARAHPLEARLGFQRNPSLWIEKTSASATTAYPAVPFEPLRRTPVGSLRYALRKRLAPVYAPFREWRRLRRRAASGADA